LITAGSPKTSIFLVCTTCHEKTVLTSNNADSKQIRTKFGRAPRHEPYNRSDLGTILKLEKKCHVKGTRVYIAVLPVHFLDIIPLQHTLLTLLTIPNNPSTVNMRFAILALPLIAAVSALPAIPQVQVTNLAPKVLKEVAELGKELTELTNAVNKFDGSKLGFIPQLLGVAGKETKVSNTVKKTTYLTKKSSNFTAAESTQIVQALAGQVTPIQGTLSAIQAKVCVTPHLPNNVY
jgi:hypothetical protein